ncbi:bile acid:sodium symporter family protein [Streptomyces radicis]|uniref:Bile acid:sodium symporter n=1 Tax=Streptomyces radicis TaxID=1750517 RepID=A0A3A9VSU0_9ACTN|nr:bile acid:sodium symporter family protein [Streptomyces radicis]RKN03839.1 bile acid:sodium symporter [Streptomyces radicis]RKN13922.1 bile acid:sodium symporter [Streptomyces radicis]
MIDPYIVLLLATVGIAALLPASGAAADVADGAATGGIGLLFFLYGARLSTGEALDGIRHWRLHLTVLAFTFAVFPLFGLAAYGLTPWLVTDELYDGLLFLCLVPSTVQSSIAFTSMARGNVAGAIAAGSFSSVLGVLLTPLLAAALIGGSGGFSADTLLAVAGQLLAPFALGQLLRRWIGAWVRRHKRALSFVDRGSILVVVYAAFSEGMNAGVWNEVSWPRLGALFGVEALLLVVMLLLTWLVARRLRFGREDRIVVVLAGSQKSLAAGLPMASVIFQDQAALAVLPLMLFHQLQLIVCAYLSRRWSRAPETPAAAGGADEGRADQERAVAAASPRTSRSAPA